MHWRCALVLAFFTAAAIWLLIEAEFLAIVLVLVYVGAVMVLFLFVVMMLDIDIEDAAQRVHALLRGWALVAAGRGRARSSAWWSRSASSGLDIEGRHGCPAGGLPATPRSWARLLYTKYLYPFELAADAAAGRHRRRHRADACAAARASRCRTSAPRWRCAREDRVRIVKMQAETRNDPMITLPDPDGALGRAVRAWRWPASSSTARTSSCC